MIFESQFEGTETTLSETGLWTTPLTSLYVAMGKSDGRAGTSSLGTKALSAIPSGITNVQYTQTTLSANGGDLTGPILYIVRNNAAYYDSHYAALSDNGSGIAFYRVTCYDDGGGLTSTYDLIGEKFVTIDSGSVAYLRANGNGTFFYSLDGLGESANDAGIASGYIGMESSSLESIDDFQGGDYLGDGEPQAINKFFRFPKYSRIKRLGFV